MRAIQGNKARHGLAAPRNHDFFAVLDFREVAREMRLGLVRGNRHGLRIRPALVQSTNERLLQFAPPESVLL